MDDSSVEATMALARTMQTALHENRLDEAAAILSELTESCGLSDDDPALMPFSVTIAIQRGRVGDALRSLNNMDEEKFGYLRAICMHLTHDPHWHGVATAIEESTTDDDVRTSMQALLGKGAGDA